ncbi:MAG: hypothetical protein H7844_10880 [Nitrospirae bacterium YQR-1]
MEISGGNNLGSLDTQQGVLMAKKALDQMKIQGEMAIKLVQSAGEAGQSGAQSPQNPAGTGTRIDLSV